MWKYIKVLNKSKKVFLLLLIVKYFKALFRNSPKELEFFMKNMDNMAKVDQDQFNILTAMLKNGI